jgi:hypothetical protein
MLVFHSLFLTLFQPLKTVAGLALEHPVHMEMLQVNNYRQQRV